MKIKSGLVLEKHKGRLIGFVDLGSVNSDINKMMSVSEEETEVLADPATNSTGNMCCSTHFKE